MQSVKNTRKIQIIKSISLCILCLITVVAAWFSLNHYAGSKMQYKKNFSIAPTGVQIDNFIGTANSNNVVTYQDAPIGENGLELNNLFPGSRVYFRTDILNKSSANIKVKLNIENIQYDPVLNTHIYLYVTNPAYSVACLRDDYTQITDQNDKTKYFHKSETLADECTVEPKQIISVYWFVYFDTELENEAQNTSLLIQKMRLSFC